ncbi:TIGR00341 family protein [Halomarina ordinaria]|uniref:TIGR00341 family protein n=1 Tax=Halomarina ordinaria TaxID=3033939 RepID=A0ABD5U7P2_9EURY|nr:TIGR00341 family protein [Halomarina sp. PSRA2]
MRSVRAILPAGTRADVERALADLDLGPDGSYAVVGAADGEADVLLVTVETETVETLLGALRDAGVDDGGTVAVNEASVVLPAPDEGSDDEGSPAEGDGENDEDDGEATGGTVSREELQAAMREELRDPVEYAQFTVLSAVLACSGLVLDSPTVITGSMVVAPLLGPAIASSVGSVVGDDDLVRTGLLAQVGGIALAVASATAFALLVRLLVLPTLPFGELHQVVEFSEPVVFTLVIALVAGVGAALSLTSDVSTALVGVAVATAVVPPAAAIGIGAAYWRPPVLAGAAVLLLVNVLSINLTSLLTLWARGYLPDGLFERRRVRTVSARRTLALALSVLVVSAAVGYVTVNYRANATFAGEVDDTVAESEVEATAITVEYEAGLLTRAPATVVVHAAVAPDGAAERLATRLESETGRSVSVVVYEASGRAGEVDVDTDAEPSAGVSAPQPSKGSSSS